MLFGGNDSCLPKFTCFQILGLNGSRFTDHAGTNGFVHELYDYLPNRWAPSPTPATGLKDWDLQGYIEECKAESNPPGSKFCLRFPGLEEVFDHDDGDRPCEAPKHGRNPDPCEFQKLLCSSGKRTAIPTQRTWIDQKATVVERTPSTSFAKRAKRHRQRNYGVRSAFGKKDANLRLSPMMKH
ncbi:uncharacterized protein BCR38DRAFT_414548 [Pseudomassariella vexata]|uniref:Uncharacterized protein n=1 Tax=Pseudomassariella vexata TaxID=1141098 RepID=A0A1Y2DBA4_9PEZI|nr:uncharacterized protein BCR38DRAFT_414548 [Pseudomassariella vexata]ORY56396.1 hypothetical protein BCR38DRAFT_414548 [Pseudomassariella vexata]